MCACMQEITVFCSLLSSVNNFKFSYESTVFQISSFLMNDVILSARCGRCVFVTCICKFSSFSFKNMSLRYASLFRNLLQENLWESPLPSSFKKMWISSRSSKTLDSTFSGDNHRDSL
ncbi:hypothetical protein ILYODFUR_037649 [Ilyodon furcidens]|uniref:Uncharacterized protein n=1 Tax=Ilyodon furcidens TaxID=33524 RepID=A0ABV0T3H9_9TELE